MLLSNSLKAAALAHAALGTTWLLPLLLLLAPCGWALSVPSTAHAQHGPAAREVTLRRREEGEELGLLSKQTEEPVLLLSRAPTLWGWTPASATPPSTDWVHMGEAENRNGAYEAWTASLSTCTGIIMTATDPRRGIYRKVVVHFRSDTGYWASPLGDWERQMSVIRRRWAELGVSPRSRRWLVQVTFSVVSLASLGEYRWRDMQASFPDPGAVPTEMWAMRMRDTTGQAHHYLKNEVMRLTGARQVAYTQHQPATLPWPQNSMYVSPRNVHWVGGVRVQGPHPQTEDDEFPGDPRYRA